MMGNPYEFRETMMSAFGYSDKSMEDLEAERKEREKKEKADSRPGRRGPRRPSAGQPDLKAVPRQSELEKLNAMLANAKPRQQIHPSE